MIHLVVEALVVGFVVMLIGFPASMIALRILPKKEDDYRPLMYLSLFLTGLFSHILFEVLNVNSWYCKNGFSCTK